MVEENTPRDCQLDDNTVRKTTKLTLAGKNQEGFLFRRFQYWLDICRREQDARDELILRREARLLMPSGEMPVSAGMAS